MKKVERTCSIRQVLTVSCAAAVLFCCGCGIVSLLGTPTRREQKVQAEYAFGEQTGRKVKKVKIRPAHLVGYDKLSSLRSNRADFSRLSPSEVGSALGADMVLLLMVERHELDPVGGSGYYKGFLELESALHEVVSGQRLWPRSGQSKSIKVGFDAGVKGRAAALKRLMQAAAHCTARYFYDCPVDQFKISDDKSDISWERWKKERSFGDAR
ncbi:MAG: hypothetical protein ACYTEL_23840 [Planctomycetota bacterium]|jgi:hypothetical protein